MDDGEWLTYDEAGQRLGILADSVRRRASAKKWPRRAGNDGKARILIPFAALTPTPDHPDDVSATESALSVEIRMLRERLAEVEKDRDAWRSHAQSLIVQRAGFWHRLFGR